MCQGRAFDSGGNDQGELLSAFLVFDSLAKPKPAFSGAMGMMHVGHPALALEGDRVGVVVAAVVQVLQRDMSYETNSRQSICGAELAATFAGDQVRAVRSGLR